MKTLLAVLALASSVCLAQTPTYQLPSAFEIAGYECGGPRPVQYVVQSNNGTEQFGLAFAGTACSAGGRGGHSTAHVGCAEVTWDESGNLLWYTVTKRESSWRGVPASWCFGNG